MNDITKCSAECVSVILAQPHSVTPAYNIFKAGVLRYSGAAAFATETRAVAPNWLHSVTHCSEIVQSIIGKQNCLVVGYQSYLFRLLVANQLNLYGQDSYFRRFPGQSYPKDWLFSSIDSKSRRS